MINKVLPTNCMALARLIDVDINPKVSIQLPTEFNNYYIYFYLNEVPR